MYHTEVHQGSFSSATLTMIQKLSPQIQREQFPQPRSKNETQTQNENIHLCTSYVALIWAVYSLSLNSSTKLTSNPRLRFEFPNFRSILCVKSNLWCFKWIVKIWNLFPSPNLKHIRIYATSSLIPNLNIFSIRLLLAVFHCWEEVRPNLYIHKVSKCRSTTSFLFVVHYNCLQIFFFFMYM